MYFVMVVDVVVEIDGIVEIVVVGEEKGQVQVQVHVLSVSK